MEFVSPPTDLMTWTVDDAKPAIGLIDGFGEIYFDAPDYGDPQTIFIGRSTVVDGVAYALTVVMDRASGRLLDTRTAPRVIVISRGAFDRHWRVIEKLEPLYQSGADAWESMHGHDWTP